MGKKVKIKFTSTIDKTIYEKSPWKNQKECFQDLLLTHVDIDLILFERESKNMIYNEEIIVLTKQYMIMI